MWTRIHRTLRVAECQDWKQNISEFKSLYKGSKIILIKQHFKPTCKIKTSTSAIQEDDPRIMFPMSSLLESRICVLHLRTMLDVQRIQKEVQQTKIGCNLYPRQRDKERRYPWCSTRQDRSTKRVPPGLECVERH